MAGHLVSIDEQLISDVRLGYCTSLFYEGDQSKLPAMLKILAVNGLPRVRNDLLFWPVQCADCGCVMAFGMIGGSHNCPRFRCSACKVPIYSELFIKHLDSQVGTFSWVLKVLLDPKIRGIASDAEQLSGDAKLQAWSALIRFGSAAPASILDMRMLAQYDHLPARAREMEYLLRSLAESRSALKLINEREYGIDRRSSRLEMEVRIQNLYSSCHDLLKRYPDICHPIATRFATNAEL